jgi:hypothetical protein
MARTRLKSNSSKVPAHREAENGASATRRVLPRAADYDNNEALWAAYRRYDRTVVTEKLLRSYWMRMAQTPPVTRKSHRRTHSTRIR